MAFLVFLILVVAGCSGDDDDLTADGGTESSESADVETAGVTEESQEADSAMEDEEGAVAEASAPVAVSAFGTQADMLEALAMAQETWESNGIVDYDITMIPTNIGDVEDGPIASEYEIEVRGGEVTSVAPEDAFSPQLSGFTIASLLEALPEAVREDDEFRVAVDVTGVPVEFGGPVDGGGETFVSIVDFRAIDE